MFNYITIIITVWIFYYVHIFNTYKIIKWTKYLFELSSFNNEKLHKTNVKKNIPKYYKTLCVFVKCR